MSTSKRIRIPSLKAREALYQDQPDPAQPPSVRRKATKRRASEPADDDLSPPADDYDDPQPPHGKRARTTESLDDDMDVDVDVDIDGDGDLAALDEDPGYLSDAAHSSKHARLSRASSAASQRRERPKSRKERTPVVAAAPSSSKGRKKPHVVYSDDEDPFEDAVGYRDAKDVDIDDEEPEPAVKRLPTVRLKLGKAGGDSKGKEKAVKSAAKAREEHTPPASKRAKLRDPSPGIDEQDAAAARAPAAPEAQKDAGPTPLPSFKKRKLPPIKKNKPAGASTSSAHASQAPAAKARPKPAEGAKAGEGTEADDGLPVLKKPAQRTGNVEVDLSNKDIYASLFKSAGASTPRSGLNKNQKEERRKELDRMRDADRARRAAEAERAFDLRAQYDKIATFVDRLGARRSSAMWPNIMAAAWRYEKEKEEKRRERDRVREKSVREHENGEVVDERGS